MADRTPIETRNLDIYGNAPLPWSRPHDLLAAGIFFGRPVFLGTTRPDCYHFTFQTAIGNATAEPQGASLWKFARS